MRTLIMHDEPVTSDVAFYSPRARDRVAIAAVASTLVIEQCASFLEARASEQVDLQHREMLIHYAAELRAKIQCEDGL